MTQHQMLNNFTINVLFMDHHMEAICADVGLVELNKFERYNTK